MVNISDLLRQSAEAHEAEVRATLSGLDEKGLEDWCRTEIGRYKKHFDPRKWSLDHIEVIRNSVTPKDQETVMEFARDSHVWRAGLIQFAKQCRRNGIEVPVFWRTFLRNVANGTEAEPDERGLARKNLRDAAICKCIQYIANCTSFNASRSGSDERACGISIVAKAEGMRYSTVETIWKRYRVWLKDTDPL